MTQSAAAVAHKSLGKALVELTKHVLAATTAFLVIFAVAIALEHLAKYLIAVSVVEKDSVLFWALLGVKYVLLLADISLLIVFLAKFGIRAARSF
jgi:hypothetical protein